MINENKKNTILNESVTYKPFRYPWAFEAWKIQQNIHWLPEEIPLADDVKDWHKNLNKVELNLLTQIFRFFTQSDVEVSNAYVHLYSKVFRPIEIQMMLNSFANMESIHIASYSHLLDTVGMPEVEYSAFLKYKQMKDKHEYLQNFNVENNFEIAKSVAVFSAFTEGLQLFASFAILLNFPRHNKMKGMGQIVTFSVRDETLHIQSMMRVFKTFISEHPEVWNDKLKNEIYKCCEDVIKLEEGFIDLAFEFGDLENLTANDVKQYIRYIANRRLSQLGLNPIYRGIDQNPLPWLDQILNGLEHTNFFENRATEYTKGSTQGTWSDVFAPGESLNCPMQI